MIQLTDIICHSVIIAFHRPHSTICHNIDTVTVVDHKKGLFLSLFAPDTKLSGYYSRVEAQDSVKLLKSVGALTLSVHEIPSSGLFKEMGDFPNISQIMKKFITYIYTMFRNFASCSFSS
jgi:hypothetical protein